jgi:spore coat protein H
MALMGALWSVSDSSLCAHAQKTGVKASSKTPPKTATQTAAKPQPSSEADLLFKSGKILQVSIELSPEAMDSLRQDGRKYVPATLKVDGKTYAQVGVHLRGAAGSSRGIDDKAGLTLNMDKFVDKQKFYGMDKFHLTNSVQDPTYAMELICGEIFREAGVPAARIAHAVVDINGKRRGLYCLKEGYDGQFLKRHFGTSDGNFYDGGFLRDIDQELEHSHGKKDVPPQSDLKALARACHEPDRSQRFKKIEALLDMDRFITYLVLEAMTWDWDGYPMNRNNYRIYHDPKRGKLVFLPSGMDQMFWDINGSVMPGWQGLVARRVMETPEGRARYLARAKELLKTVFRSDARVKRLQELEARLKPALAKFDEGAANELGNRMNGLRQSIAERGRVLAEQIKSIEQ